MYACTDKLSAFAKLKSITQRGQSAVASIAQHVQACAVKQSWTSDGVRSCVDFILLVGILRNEMQCEPHGTPTLTQFMSCSDLVLLTRLKQREKLQHMLPRLRLSLPTEA